MKLFTVILAAIVICCACTEAHKAAKRHQLRMGPCYCHKLDCRLVRLSCSDEKNVTISRRHGKSEPTKRRNRKCHPKHCHYPYAYPCFLTRCLTPCEQCSPSQVPRPPPEHKHLEICWCPYIDCSRANCTNAEGAQGNIGDEQPVTLTGGVFRSKRRHCDCPEDRCPTMREKCCPT